MQRIGKGHTSLDSFLSPNKKGDVEPGTQKMNFATHESMCSVVKDRDYNFQR